METIVAFNGDQTQIFHIEMYGHSLLIHNLTTYIKKLSKHIKNISSKIFLGKILILELSYHLRPGQSELSELNWLLDSDKVKQFCQDKCLAQFKKYCIAPVEFLAANQDFYQAMQDPWCFGNEMPEIKSNDKSLINEYVMRDLMTIQLFIASLEEFITIYSTINQVPISIYECQQHILIHNLMKELEDTWKIAFCGTPSIYELQDGGFFSIEHNVPSERLNTIEASILMS